MTAKRVIKLTVYGKPQPQGSSRAFIPKGWNRAVITSDNKELKSFRQEASKAALVARNEAGFTDVIFGKHVPVEVSFKFFFQRPASVSKKRVEHVVKPDLSKLVRAAEDSLTGIIFHDDSQIVSYGSTRKEYGLPERAEITVTECEANER
jgi:Holliday junction resolvase RusA-like endonuclease